MIENLLDFARKRLYSAGLVISAFVMPAHVIAMTGPQTASVAVSGQGSWETTLQGRYLSSDHSQGFDAFYDTSRNITWLANANLANQRMTWQQSQNWVSSLNLSGWTGWRLPEFTDVIGNILGRPCEEQFASGQCGYNVDTTFSELASMFYSTLGNNAYYDASGNEQPGFGLTNSGPFKNLPEGEFWYRTPSVTDANASWGFETNFGGQFLWDKNDQLYAWAVKDGDFLMPIPEPSTLILLFAGMVVVLQVSNRRRQSAASPIIR